MRFGTDAGWHFAFHRRCVAWTGIRLSWERSAILAVNMLTDNPYAMAIVGDSAPEPVAVIIIVGVLGAAGLFIWLFEKHIERAKRPEIERIRRQFELQDAARLAIRRADEEYNSKLHAAILGDE